MSQFLFLDLPNAMEFGDELEGMRLVQMALDGA
jgi:hypothetical protein